MAKWSSEIILADENRTVFRGKGESEKFSEIGRAGNLKQEGNASLPREDGRPCTQTNRDRQLQTHRETDIQRQTEQ